MYIADVDQKLLFTKEHLNMQNEYKQRFGEQFISFNYADFRRQGEKCAAQVYLETLKRALEENKPYHIQSHRYDVFDH